MSHQYCLDSVADGGPTIKTTLGQCFVFARVERFTKGHGSFTSAFTIFPKSSPITQISDNNYRVYVWYVIAKRQQLSPILT